MFSFLIFANIKEKPTIRVQAFKVSYVFSL